MAKEKLALGGKVYFDSEAVDAAYDDGGAAALRGNDTSWNPYDPDIQPNLFTAWNQGCQDQRNKLNGPPGNS